MGIDFLCIDYDLFQFYRAFFNPYFIVSRAVGYVYAGRRYLHARCFQNQAVAVVVYRQLKQTVSVR